MDEAGLRESREVGSVHHVQAYSDLVQGVPIRLCRGRSAEHWDNSGPASEATQLSPSQISGIF